MRWKITKENYNNTLFRDFYNTKRHHKENQYLDEINLKGKNQEKKWAKMSLFKRNHTITQAWANPSRVFSFFFLINFRLWYLILTGKERFLEVLCCDMMYKLITFMSRTCMFFLTSYCDVITSLKGCYKCCFPFFCFCFLWKHSNYYLLKSFVHLLSHFPCIY